MKSATPKSLLVTRFLLIALIISALTFGGYLLWTNLREDKQPEDLPEKPNIEQYVEYRPENMQIEYLEDGSIKVTWRNNPPAKAFLYATPNVLESFLEVLELEFVDDGTAGFVGDQKTPDGVWISNDGKVDPRMMEDDSGVAVASDEYLTAEGEERSDHAFIISAAEVQRLIEKSNLPVKVSPVEDWDALPEDAKAEFINESEYKTTPNKVYLYIVVIDGNGYSYPFGKDNNNDSRGPQEGFDLILVKD